MLTFSAWTRLLTSWKKAQRIPHWTRVTSMVKRPPSLFPKEHNSKYAPRESIIIVYFTSEYFVYQRTDSFSARYWEDPYAFKPSRFLNPNWPRDAFIPFSTGKPSSSFTACHRLEQNAGPRACIGRKFVIPCFHQLEFLNWRVRVVDFLKRRA